MMAKRQRVRAKAEAEPESLYFVSDKKHHSFVGTGCTVLDNHLGGGYVLGRIANIVGDKCLSGDTIVSAQRGIRGGNDPSGPRPRKMTMQTLFNRVKGNHWNRNDDCETYLTADVGGFVGVARLVDIVMSGEKVLYEIKNDRGDTIRATEDHKFATENGWACLADCLKVGTVTKIWRGTRNKIEIQKNRKPRKSISGIKFHPFGWQNVAGGYNYKRLPAARLVIEAAINDLTLQEFVSILRGDPVTASTLQYTDPKLDVHHLNGDCLDDRLENLQLIDPIEHWEVHSQEMPKNTKSIDISEIVSICKAGIEPTFDITMEAPHHNFIANNFIVHNSTAKTALATEAIINFLRAYPHGKAHYTETEAAYDKEYAVAMGLPIDKVDFGDEENPLTTVEDFAADLEAFVERQTKAGCPGIYVLDSLDALSDEAEMKRELNKGTYGTSKAKNLSIMFRKLSRKIEQSKVTVIIVSQVRDNIGAMFGEKHKRSGGHALDFYASQIVWLAYIGRVDRTINGVKRPIGISVLANVKKNKVSIPFRKVEFNFIFGFGIDDCTSSIKWLAEVKRLGDFDLTESGMSKYLKEVDTLNSQEYRELQDQLRPVVQKVWREVETSFLPARSKYT